MQSFGSIHRKMTENADNCLEILQRCIEYYTLELILLLKETNQSVEKWLREGVKKKKMEISIRGGVRNFFFDFPSLIPIMGENAIRTRNEVFFCSTFPSL